MSSGESQRTDSEIFVLGLKVGLFIKTQPTVGIQNYRIFIKLSKKISHFSQIDAQTLAPCLVVHLMTTDLLNALALHHRLK